MSLCRACLSSGVELITVDDSFVGDYNLLTNIDVQPLDGKSQHFCHSCVETVNYFIQFRNKCTSSELALQQICSSQVVKVEDCQMIIKGEIKHENDDSSYEADFDAKTEYEFEIKVEKSDIPEKKPKKQSKKKKKPVIKKIENEKPHEPTLDENYIKIISDSPACGLCGKLFDDICLLNKHLEEHRKDSYCRLCPAARFEQWPPLLAHRMLHTAKSQQCHLCSQKFRSHTHLEFHYWKVHCGVNNAAVTCSHCPRKFSTPKRLSKHKWRSHSSKKYVCDICSKQYNNKQMLKLHINGHSNARRYSCDLCGYSSKFRTGVHAHKIRKHSPRKCICKICERAFADPDKMAKHICTEVSKVCPVCGKKLRRGLARHMAMHDAKPRYACPRCPTTYRSRSALKVHLDKHDNNPTQKCEVCQARFYSPSVLIKHRRVHTGEKPYACNKCHMRFTGNNNLKVHMKVHGEMLIVKKNAEAESNPAGTKPQ